MIQPFMVTKLTHALEDIENFPGMTITQARGFGQEKAQHHATPHARIEDLVDTVEKTRVEIVARDEMVDRIVETIVSVVHTGNPGDGKIFVWTVDRAIRVRTGEKDDAALSKGTSKEGRA